MKGVSLAVLAMVAAGLAIMPAAAQAGGSCGSHKCYVTVTHDYSVPFPSHIGNNVGHFDEYGTPQSIVTPSDTSQEEVPCPPRHHST